MTCFWSSNCYPVPLPLFPGLSETASPINMQEENRLLQKELSRLEDLLAHTRAEKDELASKYHAISERVKSDFRNPSKNNCFA